MQLLRSTTHCLFFILLLLSHSALAEGISNIAITNNPARAVIILSSATRPTYSYVSMHNPARLILDINQSGAVTGLPIRFSGSNLLQAIRVGEAKDRQRIQLIIELSQASDVKAHSTTDGQGYQVVLTIERQQVTQPVRVMSRTEHNRPIVNAAAIPRPVSVPTRSRTVEVANDRRATATKQAATSDNAQIGRAQNKIVVVIDAGHGGQDPGAVGQNGLREKDVTLAIATILNKKLLDDPLFHSVLTRDSDYFISVMGRSDVARKGNANVLVSIHADSAPNRAASGSSVWVLSNRRANNELANWLEQREKQSELLGGAGDLFASRGIDPYLSQAVLDLQFGHSQRVAYDIAVAVLKQLGTVSPVHKQAPSHASLGVLRSPDIPSLLIETGFISNATEEQRLRSSTYQEAIAQSIYLGLRDYFSAHPLQQRPQTKKQAK